MLKLSHINGLPVEHHVALTALSHFRPCWDFKTLPKLPNTLPHALDTRKGAKGERTNWPVVAMGASKTFDFIIAKPPRHKRKQFRDQQGEWYALVNLGDRDCHVWVGVALAHVHTGDTPPLDRDVPGWIVGCPDWPAAWVAAVRDLVCGSEAA